MIRFIDEQDYLDLLLRSVSIKTENPCDGSSILPLGTTYLLSSPCEKIKNLLSYLHIESIGIYYESLHEI